MAIPVKGMLQRFAFLSLVLAAFGLLLLGRAETVLVERLRTSLTDVVAPVLDVLSRPVATVGGLVDDVRELVALRAENARLRGEVERAGAWHTVARRLEAENRALRDMLRFTSGPRMGFISARVIADGGGPFVRSVLLNAGARDGVKKGRAAVNGAGLVGRVSEAGHRSARVLLLTDMNSRIPVVVESTRLRAILAGDNSDRPLMVFLPEDAEVAPGERIVTSGHGGALPPGLPVGTVASAHDGSVRVKPFVDWDRLEYVRVIELEPVGSPPGPAATRRAKEGR